MARLPRPQPVPQTGLEPVDRALRQQHELTAALAAQPLASARWFYAQTLADGVTTLVPHGLGRALTSFLHCDLRGASTSGRVERITQGVDESKHLAVRATGYGAPITVTIAVW